MVRAGSSSSSGGGGGEAGGGGGGGGGGGAGAGAGAAAGAGRRGRSRQRSSRRRRLSANCPGADKMSPGMKKVECFSPMLCHCKVACTNSTISLMFGCKAARAARRLRFAEPDQSEALFASALRCDWLEHQWQGWQAHACVVNMCSAGKHRRNRKHSHTSDLLMEAVN
ncbi:discs large homolog 1-like protein isoform X5 [Lates japonicus]|uniref:Discs large homolog 1-like protein isoform X5 n=1 Tax=Lates japonicus TaxID=270547 RepID=A0AAD3QVK2_LATJO|nr:discs large homolog 1-like protein isoform X5 [Lates japonicus]